MEVTDDPKIHLWMTLILFRGERMQPSLFTGQGAVWAGQWVESPHFAFAKSSWRRWNTHIKQG